MLNASVVGVSRGCSWCSISRHWRGMRNIHNQSVRDITAFDFGLNIWSLIVSHKINCKPYFKVHEEPIWHDVTIQVQENAPQRVCGVLPRLDVGKLVRPWHDQDDCCCWLVRCWAAFHGASCAARRSCPKLVALTSTRRWRPPQLCQPWRC